MKIIQTKGEGLGLLIWVWVADHELANSTELDFKRFNRVWTWIIRDDLSPRWDQEKIIPIDLSTFRRRICFEKLSPSARFEILSVGWGNVSLVVFEFELGVKINYNLILTFVIICLWKFQKSMSKTRSRKNNSKIEKNELTFMTLNWLIQIIELGVQMYYTRSVWWKFECSIVMIRCENNVFFQCPVTESKR